MAYRFTTLDSELMETGELAMVRSASVERTCSGDSPLLESCDIEYDAVDVIAYEGWLRIERDGRPLGVFYVKPDGMKLNRGIMTVSALGESVLKPAAETPVRLGAHLPKGGDAVAFAAQMLSVCPGRVTYEGMASSDHAIVFQDGDSRLDAAWAALDSVGWCMSLDDGDIILKPLPTDVSRVVTDHDGGIVPGIEIGGSVSYERADDGLTDLFDVVEVRLPSIGINRLVTRVESQSLALGNQIRIKEVCS